MQTECFVSFYLKTDPALVKEEMKHCSAFQAELGAAYTAKTQRPVEKKIVYIFGSNPQYNAVRGATESFLNDEVLQNELRNKFGVSFLDIGVVVLPSEQIDSVEHIGDVGITIDGWKDAKQAAGRTDVGGFTLHDNPRYKPRTEDGRPRIVLNPKAFESLETLRLTMLHELLHAINVPGVDPWPPTFAQNDLTYLPEYRLLVKEKGLQGWHETLIWVLAVIVPFILLVRLGRRAWLYTGERRQTARR